MVVNNVVHVNECGLPLNAIEWLEKHHQSKAYERRLMIQDLQIQTGSFIVDAGCGPGLWSPLLAEATGNTGRILGIDIAAEALITAQKRSITAWYRHFTHYKRALLEQIPVQPGEVDFIFSANVSQYLPDPVTTFAAMGRALKPGGRLAIKDIDFGRFRFYGIDPALQERVLQARLLWEQVRVQNGFSFEDSWVGPRLAGYLQRAGFTDIRVQTYPIVRAAPLPPDYRFYLQGIAQWFICEEARFLSQNDVTCWLQCFFQQSDCILDHKDFACEETEYVVSGTWIPTS